jgi:hypothetical protein
MQILSRREALQAAQALALLISVCAERSKRIEEFVLLIRVFQSRVGITSEVGHRDTGAPSLERASTSRDRPDGRKCWDRSMLALAV